jgi:hypothetical protein
MVSGAVAGVADRYLGRGRYTDSLYSPQHCVMSSFTHRSVNHSIGSSSSCIVQASGQDDIHRAQGTLNRCPHSDRHPPKPSLYFWGLGALLIACPVRGGEQDRCPGPQWTEVRGGSSTSNMRFRVITKQVPGRATSNLRFRVIISCHAACGRVAVQAGPWQAPASASGPSSPAALGVWLVHGWRMDGVPLSEPSLDAGLPRKRNVKTRGLHTQHTQAGGQTSRWRNGSPAPPAARHSRVCRW